MRFAIGAAVVDVIVDDDDYRLPLSGFLPGLDAAALAPHRAVLVRGRRCARVRRAGDALEPVFARSVSGG
jgi:hypothetical protein